MTKMAAVPIYGKNPLKSSSQNQSNKLNKTGYVALGTAAHHNLFKV